MRGGSWLNPNADLSCLYRFMVNQLAQADIFHVKRTPSPSHSAEGKVLLFYTLGPR